MQITDFREVDLDDVLTLNEAAVPHVNSLDREAMQWFAANARYFRVATNDGAMAGFLIGLQPGLDYSSPNYQWFCSTYRRFGYVDRVVVASTARRRGVASQLYDDYASTLRGYVPLMTCEVNIRPSNESSMAYHERHGFVQVATQETEGGKKEVALMEKKL
ncbi:MAG: GNAT family N-acetyltransferase [Woeseiaceae bacterium]|nr:GNAT family N-acetyltransferase [Woeseiaceae bacterium]